MTLPKKFESEKPIKFRVAGDKWRGIIYATDSTGHVKCTRYVAVPDGKDDMFCVGCVADTSDLNHNSAEFEYRSSLCETMPECGTSAHQAKYVEETRETLVQSAIWRIQS